MATVAIASAETGDMNETQLNAGSISAQNTTVHDGVYAYKATAGSGEFGTQDFPSALGTVYFRAWIRITQAPSSLQTSIKWRTAADATIASIDMNTSRQLDVGGTTSTTALAVNTWYRIEARYTKGTGSDGIIQVKINGTTEIDISTSDVTDDVSYVLFEFMSDNGDTFWDSIVCDDTTWVGDGGTVALRPNADDSTRDTWEDQAAGATTWSTVDETPFSTTDYATSPASGAGAQAQEWDLTTQASVGTVNTVAVLAYAQKTSGGSSERLAPDAILASSNLSGSVADIDDDPDSPDANWLTATGTNTSVRVSFGTPSGTPSVGADLQEFRVQVRKDATGGGDPSADVVLFENGSAVRTIISGQSITQADPGTVLSATWNANELGTADGSLVECRVVGTKGGGGPNERNLEVGAIEWNATLASSTTHKLSANNSNQTSRGLSADLGLTTSWAWYWYFPAGTVIPSSQADVDAYLVGGEASASGDPKFQIATAWFLLDYLASTFTEATAAASGAATVAGTGASISEAPAASSGAATVSATGASTHEATAAASGAATVSAVGEGFSQAAGAASGVATTAAVGASTHQAVAAASGTATISGVGASTAEATATSTASASVSGVGASIAEAVFAASGLATTSAVGQAIYDTVGASSGLSTIAGVGESTFSGVGASSGVGAVAATAESTAAATAASSGVVTASGVGASIAEATAATSGTVAVAGVGEGFTQAVGASSGVAAVSATGEATHAVPGASSGVSVVSGTGASTAEVTGAASGTVAAAAAGASTAESSFASSGTATVDAVGEGFTGGVAAASGTSTVSATASATHEAVAAGSGVASSSGIGAATVEAVAASAGLATASIVGASTFSATAAASGIATISGIGASISAATATASGLSTIAASGVSIFAGVFAASGAATAAGVGTDIGAANQGVAASSGLATVAGVGAAISEAAAAASGLATIAGIGSAVFPPANLVQARTAVNVHPAVVQRAECSILVSSRSKG